MSSTATENKPQTRHAGIVRLPSGERTDTLIELNGVTRRYGRLVALRNVSLKVTPGEFVFLIGPSEAGKTTLLKLIHGDLRPNRGRVRVDRHLLHRRWRRFMPALRREVAAVFQDGRLLGDMTARGNVAFALQVADLGMPSAEVRARAQARLDEVGLGGRPNAFPHQLSGGQQRRLAIARALGHAPILLLADEPTANLDRGNAERVLDLLERRCQAGTTVIVATHDLDLALARPHRVVELREGRIVADHPARAPLPGNGSAAAMLAARDRDEARLATRTSQLLQLVLGYTPPPPPLAPPARVALATRAGKLAQLMLGYESPPPRAALPAARSAWSPPQEVAERPLPNGAVHPAPTGGWRPPESLAPALPQAGSPNGVVKREPRLRERAERVARFVLGYTPPPPATGPRPGAGEFLSRLMQLVLGYAPPPKPARAAKRPALGRRRWPWTPVVNLFRLAVGGAVTTWIRNFGTAAPALGSITLLLLLTGALSVSGVGVRTLLASQEADASVLHVYLDDAAGQDQVDQTRQALAGLPHVRSVTYLGKDQALAQARKRPGLGDLASLSDTNPFPASLEVQIDNPGDVAAVAKTAATEQGVDTRQPTSYDAGTYDRLRQFTVVAAGIAGGFGLLLLIITYVISSNSIRAAVLARRDELLTMQLVGASRFLIRARLAVEGALTGGLAGVLAAGVVAGASLAAYYGQRGLFLQVLPGLTVVAAAEVVAIVAALGLVLGSVSALFAFRRLRT